MIWITPKTDWTEKDDVTIVDFNRIINNIKYLQNEYMWWQYRTGNIQADTVGRDKRGLLALANEIENAVWDIDRSTISDSISLWEQSGNVPSWDYSDFNRIERHLERFKANLDSIKANANYLPFIMGVELYGDRIYSV